MTYLQRGGAVDPSFSFRRQRPTVRFGMGDDDSGLATINKVLQSFMPEINEIQAQSDVEAQIAVDAFINKDNGNVGIVAAAPVATTTTGSTAPSSAGAGDFIVIGNACKPRNKPALDAAKLLQLQLNRLGRAKGAGTITVDGDIGPQTLGLLARVSPASSSANCQALTAQLGAVTAALQSVADSAGAPQTSAQDLAKAAQAGAMHVAATNGKTYQFKPPGVHASLMDKVKSLPDTTKIILGGAALLGGIFAFKRLRARGAGGAPAAPKTALPAILTTPAPAVSNPRRRRRRRR